jgi:hypothetical protein
MHIYIYKKNVDQMRGYGRDGDVSNRYVSVGRGEVTGRWIEVERSEMVDVDGASYGGITLMERNEYKPPNEARVVVVGWCRDATVSRRRG